MTAAEFRHRLIPIEHREVNNTDEDNRLVIVSVRRLKLFKLIKCYTYGGEVVSSVNTNYFDCILMAICCSTVLVTMNHNVTEKLIKQIKRYRRKYSVCVSYSK